MFPQTSCCHTFMTTQPDLKHCEHSRACTCKHLSGAGQSRAAKAATATDSADFCATTISDPSPSASSITASGSLLAVTTPTIASEIRQQPQSSPDSSMQSHPLDCSEHEDEELGTPPPGSAEPQSCMESIADDASRCLDTDGQHSTD